MAAKEPNWSCGGVVQYNSSGTDPDPDTGGWSYGQVAQQHEYVAGAAPAATGFIPIIMSHLQKMRAN